MISGGPGPAGQPASVHISLVPERGPLTDVGCPSVCCEYVLLLLVNKEAALVCGRAEYSKAGNPSRDRGEKKAELGSHHIIAEGVTYRHQ